MNFSLKEELLYGFDKLIQKKRFVFVTLLIWMNVPKVHFLIKKNIKQCVKSTSKQPRLRWDLMYVYLSTKVKTEIGLIWKSFEYYTTYFCCWTGLLFSRQLSNEAWNKGRGKYYYYYYWCCNICDWLVVGSKNTVGGPLNSLGCCSCSY